MRTNARRGAHALTMVVLTAAVSLSGRVEAQQTGLFPLAPIRRQRVPCDQEDPTYKIYKSQYFGYHPTGWRTFPQGWSIPSPEAPNLERSLKEIKPGSEREEAELGMPPEEGEAPPPRQRGVGVPNLPERQPDVFEREGPAGVLPAPLPRGNEQPRAPQPRGAENPFDEVNPPQGAVRAPSPNRSQARSVPPTTDEGAPELSAPARQPAQGSAYRSGRADSDGNELASDSQGPLLGLADSDIVRSDTSAADDPTSGAPAADSTTAATESAPAPAAQPRRRFFGNLFSSIGSSWTRR